MSKFTKALILVCIIVACILFLPPFKNNEHAGDNEQTSEMTFGYTRMYFELDDTLNGVQLDSLINADTLDVLEGWIKTPFGDRTQYMFIRSMERDKEVIYTITTTDIDTLYKCIKRVTNETDE